MHVCIYNVNNVFMCVCVRACVCVCVWTERGIGTRREGGGGAKEIGTVTAKERNLRASGSAVEALGHVAGTGVCISYIRYALCVFFFLCVCVCVYMDSIG
jgi:hypothetical protein